MTGTGLDGSEVRFEGTGMLARCLQHETDHLDGILFPDRVDIITRESLLQQWAELRKQLADVHIEAAKGLMKKYFIRLPDPDLAYLVEGTDEFRAYIKSEIPKWTAIVKASGARLD